MRKIIKLLIVFLLIICMCVFVSCYDSSNSNIQIKKKIGLIVKMNYGNHWGTVKLGADAAAREFNVNIYYNGPDDEKDVDGQIKLINSALEDEKVDALIVAASDYQKLVEVIEKAYDLKVPVIIIDSEVNSNKINSYISIDNVDAGSKAAKILIESYGNKSCNLAVINFVKGSRNAEQREEGLMKVLKGYPQVRVIDRLYCYSDEKLAVNLTNRILNRHQKIDAVVALNDIASEGVAEAVEQMGISGTVKIIGFGSSPKEVDYMEKGIIQAIIVQNPFSMGYLGVKYAVDVLNGKEVPRSVDTNLKIITQENMYLPENQKLLFPFVK